MIRSMTGYGKQVVLLETGRIVVEIRSVNHRYGEVFIKLPRTFMELESEVRKTVSEQIRRGKIEVFILIEGMAGSGGIPKINIPLARAYYDAFIKLKESLGLYDPVPLSLIAAQKDLLVTDEVMEQSDNLHEEILEGVRSAVKKHDEMRRREGEALLQDLQKRRQMISGLITGISGRSPHAASENIARFRGRVKQMTEDTGIDEARLVQEIALMSDRWDINEELVRFNSHLAQFDDTLKLDEPVGRRLDFIIQELNREVNTIGSKANDAEITSLIVELKAELEKIREQVQNIE